MLTHLQENIKDSEYEVIIVDDNSSDNSFKIIKKFDFDNFVLIKNKNLGLPLSINKAFRRLKVDILSELIQMTMFHVISHF